MWQTWLCCSRCHGYAKFTIQWSKTETKPFFKESVLLPLSCLFSWPLIKEPTWKCSECEMLKGSHRLSSCFSFAFRGFISVPFLVCSYPGRVDGRHHHGNGHDPSRATLLPSGSIRKLQSSGWCQGVLRLCSSCWRDLVGTKGMK